MQGGKNVKSRGSSGRRDYTVPTLCAIAKGEHNDPPDQILHGNEKEIDSRVACYL